MMDSSQPIPPTDAELVDALDGIVNSGRVEMVDAVLIAETTERLKLRPLPMHGSIKPKRGTGLT